MDFEELKKIRKEKLLAHKRKKRDYYLKNKKESKKIVYNYEEDLADANFDFKIKEIIKHQKEHVDSRKEKIIKNIVQYKEKKQEYYLINKDKRLNYDKEYREKRKEELKEYRKNYYEQNKDKIHEQNTNPKKKEEMKK